MKKRPKFPHPPLDIDPGIVSGDHSALVVARRAFTSLHTGWKVLAEASERVQDSDKLSREAKAHTDKMVRLLRADTELMWGAYRHLRQKIDAAISPNERDPIAAELRAWLRSQSDPFTAALKGIKSADKRYVSAILGAPSALSGLDDDKLELLRDHAARLFEFEDHEAMETIDKLARKHGEYVERFEKQARQHIKSWETGDDAAIEELFRAK